MMRVISPESRPHFSAVAPRLQDPSCFHSPVPGAHRSHVMPLMTGFLFIFANSPVACPSVPLFSGILRNLVFKPVLRPLFRVLTGALAIPAFRFVMRHLLRRKQLSSEMERDLEMWFRGAVILLAATANLEDFLFGWLPWHKSEDPWLTMLLRLLLAIGVIESMPDQDVFGIVHRGPPKAKWTSLSGLRDIWRRRREFILGFCVLHLKRSSPVFVIMTVIFGNAPGTREFIVGWIFYGLAVAQYLIIGLITERDRIEGLLQQFDRSADVIRKEILSGEDAGPPGETRNRP